MLLSVSFSLSLLLSLTLFHSTDAHPQYIHRGGGGGGRRRGNDGNVVHKNPMSMSMCLCLMRMRMRMICVYSVCMTK